MANAKPPKYVWDAVRNGRYVRAWRDRAAREVVVQVWNGPAPDGEPAGDWGRP